MIIIGRRKEIRKKRLVRQLIMTPIRLFLKSNNLQDKTRQTQQNRHTHKSMCQSIFTLYDNLYHYGLCSALFIETLTKHNKE